MCGCYYLGRLRNNNEKLKCTLYLFDKQTADKPIQFLFIVHQNMYLCVPGEIFNSNLVYFLLPNPRIMTYVKITYSVFYWLTW